MLVMADTETPATPSSADSVAPASPPPVSAPAPDSTPVVTTPAASPEAASSSTAATDTATATPATPASPPSALASEPAKEPEVKPEGDAPAKPEEKKPEETNPDAATETKPETKPEGEQPELPKFEAFKLPDGFKPDEKVLGEVSTLLGQLELAKGDHKATQEIGQKLVDLHAARMTKTIQDMTDYYKQVWEQQKADDFKALQKDAILGGDPKTMETTARSMANFLQKSGGTKEEVKAFREFVQARGVDNALPVARVLNNLKAKIESYENESSKMLPANKPMSSAPAHPGKGMIQKLYGKK